MMTLLTSPHPVVIVVQAEEVARYFDLYRILSVAQLPCRSYGLVRLGSFTPRMVQEGFPQLLVVDVDGPLDEMRRLAEESKARNSLLAIAGLSHEIKKVDFCGELIMRSDSADDGEEALASRIELASMHFRSFLARNVDRRKLASA